MKTLLRRAIRGAACLIPLVFLFFPSLCNAAQIQERNLVEKRRESRSELPTGMVLPVRLNDTLSVRKTKPGRSISARIMQDVSLPNGGKIPEGSKVLGTVISVQAATQGRGGGIALRFDKIVTRKGSYSVVTSLRAVAGLLEVQEAQTPEFSPGFGTPYNWADRRQIGGDEVYGVGGPVTNRWNERVGTAIDGGVLVHVRANPEAKCRGALDAEDRPQALWVFSADACGVYGIEGLKIAHTGRSEPAGEIQLSAAKGDMVLRSASAMLLRVLR